MAEKNKKGIEKKEYPKLIRTEDGKRVRVLSKEEEARYSTPEAKEDKKKPAPAGGWGNS